MELIAIRHAQRTIPDLSLLTAPARKEIFLTADYTALVGWHQSTSVPVRPRQILLFELYRKLLAPHTSKPLGKTPGYQVE
jgi:hypothetical protein